MRDIRSDGGSSGAQLRGPRGVGLAINRGTDCAYFAVARRCAAALQLSRPATAHLPGLSEAGPSLRCSLADCGIVP